MKSLSRAMDRVLSHLLSGTGASAGCTFECKLYQDENGVTCEKCRLTDCTVYVHCFPPVE